MNSHSAATADRELTNAEPIPESNPDLPAPTESSESSELSEPTSESQSPPALAQMTPTQIQIPHQVMTCSPPQAKLPQPATEHIDPDYPSITTRLCYNAYTEDPK